MPNSKPFTLKQRAQLLLARLFRYLPLAWVSAIGGFLGARQGRRAIRANRLWVRRMHQSYAALFGAADENTREQRIIAHTRHVGEVYAEIPVIHRMIKAGQLDIVGQAHLENLSKPVILVSAHMANWELVGHIAELVGGRISDIYLPLANPVQALITQEIRAQWRFANNQPVHLVQANSSAMRTMTKSLTQGNNLLLFIDEVKDSTVQSPRLGRNQAHRGNLWFAARLAVRFGVDILPIHIEPAGVGRYRAIIEPKLSPAAFAGNDKEQKQALAERLDQTLTAWIIKHPDHWYWLPMLALNHSSNSGH